MNKRVRAKDNEFLILEKINIQTWVRETELVILTGLSLAMVRRTCIRLADDGDITRLRHASGYVVRLTKNGAAKIPFGQSSYKTQLPQTWRHDCLAIQAMGHIKIIKEADFDLPGYKISIATEALLRSQGTIKGKIPDGQLEEIAYSFETEWSKKVGVPMKVQSEHVCQKAMEGFVTVIAYPFTPNIRGTINHELALTNSLRSIWGEYDMPNIIFLRCYFTSRLDMDHVRPSKFEQINVPRLLDNNTAAVPDGSETNYWVQ